MLKFSMIVCHSSFTVKTTSNLACCYAILALIQKQYAEAKAKAYLFKHVTFSS